MWISQRRNAEYSAGVTLKMVNVEHCLFGLSFILRVIENENTLIDSNNRKRTLALYLFYFLIITRSAPNTHTIFNTHIGVSIQWYIAISDSNNESFLLVKYR